MGADQVRVAVLCAEAGQGSTAWATGLGWSAAADRSVLLVDGDAAGGRLAARLRMKTDRSIATAYSVRGLGASDLELQAEPMERRPGLRVVPGFATPGPPSLRLVEALGEALPAVEADLVVVDLGAPLRYPGLALGEAAVTAQLIGRSFHQAFVVVRAEPDLLALTARLLRTAHLPRTRLVIHRPARWAGRDDARALIREHIGEYPIAGEWDWDRERHIAAAATGEPVWKAGMAEELGLFGSGRVVERQPSWWSARRLPRRKVS